MDNVQIIKILTIWNSKSHFSAFLVHLSLHYFSLVVSTNSNKTGQSAVMIVIAAAAVA
jgi:hypothetical protein